MMKNIFLIIIMFLLLYGCNKQSKSKLYFTFGLTEDPNEPRWGLEISEDSIFICEEIIIRQGLNRKGIYKFYNITEEINKISLLTKIVNTFNYIDKGEEVDFYVNDAQEFELYYFSTEDLNIKIQNFFICNRLSKAQFELVDELQNLKKLKKEIIKYRYFPERLLKEKFPPAPSLPREKR